jgi:uncharacterized protein YndB with AHSA1/START domain/uncharacterized damage-inducible protein DinB
MERSTGTTTTFDLEMERTLAATPERVFAAWTEPELMRRWFGPQGTRVAEVESDAREGGDWRVVMENVETGERHIVVGTFRELRPPRTLVTTWAWLEGGKPGGPPGPKTVITVRLREVEAGTRMTVHHRGFETAESREGHRTGWESTFDRLEQVAPGLDPDAEDGEVEGVRAAVAAQLALVYDTVAANVAGLTHHDSLIQPEGGGNCANWILGHMTDVHNRLMELVGEEPVWAHDNLPSASSGPITGPEEAVEWPPLRDHFLESRERCLTAVRELTPGALTEGGLPHPFGGTATRADLLVLLAFHQAYHAGQLALSRRMAGYPGAVRGPDAQAGGDGG